MTKKVDIQYLSVKVVHRILFSQISWRLTKFFQSHQILEGASMGSHQSLPVGVGNTQASLICRKEIEFHTCKIYS